jgi:hypothetical protein
MELTNSLKRILTIKALMTAEFIQHDSKIKILNNSLRKTKWNFYFLQGDFTQWNMYERNGKIALYDWELA